MRDAFGGAFMIRLFLVFIFIYIFFTAIALNYAKAFKVKNRVIDYLEDNGINSLKKSEISAADYDRMEKYFENEILNDLKYKVSSEMKCKNDDLSGEVYCSNGIRITQKNSKRLEEDGMTGTYYRVETFFAWDLGFLTKLLALGKSNENVNVSRGIWVISGETRTILRR